LNMPHGQFLKLVPLKAGSFPTKATVQLASRLGVGR
jgi:hypothetical protein